MTQEKRADKKEGDLESLVEGIVRDTKELKHMLDQLHELITDVNDDTAAIRDILSTYEQGPMYMPDSDYDFLQNGED